MNWLDATLPSPAENLALDEALLDAAESSDAGECLRFWESKVHFVVVGYANKVATETNPAVCEGLGIPILRRCSGGGTVLQGPGVLNYTLILRIAEDGPLANITSANRFIMQRNADALTQLLSTERGCPSRSASASQPSRAGKPTASATISPAAAETVALRVEVQGHTDLAIGGLKFSGNAQRRKRHHLLFHGAILLNLDLDLLEQVLPMPTLRPEYRDNRSHREFLMQFNAPAKLIKEALRQAWSAKEPLDLASRWPGWRASVERLVAERYSHHDWNFRI